MKEEKLVEKTNKNKENQVSAYGPHQTAVKSATTTRDPDEFMIE
jgi:hypothetical protein